MVQQAALKQDDPSGQALPRSLTEDGFLGGRVKILQPERGYRAGIDAVFLAATIPMEPGQTAFEAGYGVGVVSLCLAARVAGVHITGVEIASRYSMLAEENIRRNNFTGNIHPLRSCMIAVRFGHQVLALTNLMGWFDPHAEGEVV